MPHGSHCCKKHGCKYGHDDCPVVLGIVKQEFKQECCEWEEVQLTRAYKAVLADMKEKNLLSITTHDVETFIKNGRESDYW